MKLHPQVDRRRGAAVDVDVIAAGIDGDDALDLGTLPGDRVRVIRNPGPVPMPILLRSWPSFWRHGQWNEIRARIVGTPAHITTWINGTKMMEWTETEKRLGDKGGIALQVHGGGDLTKQFVRYRNVRVKRLDGAK